MRKTYTLLIGLFLSTAIHAQTYSLREQAQIKDELLADRLDNLLPELMDATGFDMWILISREYNEDPVLKTMLPATWLNARRRTILVFYKNPSTQQLEKLAIARYNVGEHFISVWDKEKQPNQWQALVDLIKTRNPKKIGINVSKSFNIADGLDHTDYSELMAALPKKLHKKVQSSEDLAIRWIETRSAKEMRYFADLTRQTHEIIAEAFSNRVITPGVTTADDVVWWMRQKLSDLGMNTWFHPTVDIQRSGNETDEIIREGDLLHCDFGISYLGLNTDCQQMAYVLKAGEKTVPSALQQAFDQGNGVQDVLTRNFVVGKTGNEILKTALTEGISAGLRPQIYTHPLGSYGHSAGPTIGMWDAQQGVPVAGDYPLHLRTAYAIELNAMVFYEPWQKDIRIALEEPGYFDENGFRYVHQRQTEIIAIPPKNGHLGDLKH